MATITRSTHWQAWLEPYADPMSALSRRLAIVQTQIRAWLDAQNDRPVFVVSVCAGDGRDVADVLAARVGARKVRARLVELDPGNAAAARARTLAAGLSGVEVAEADAGMSESYTGAVPADLVLMCGVFGNISDLDVERTIAAAPQLCAAGATVIWTRTRRAPDLTPSIRGWFERAGFDEVAFDAPEGFEFSVGVHRLRGPGRPLRSPERWFTFRA